MVCISIHLFTKWIDKSSSIPYYVSLTEGAREDVPNCQLYVLCLSYSKSFFRVTSFATPSATQLSGLIDLRTRDGRELLRTNSCLSDWTMEPTLMT